MVKARKEIQAKFERCHVAGESLMTSCALLSITTPLVYSDSNHLGVISSSENAEKGKFLTCARIMQEDVSTRSLAVLSNLSSTRIR